MNIGKYKQLFWILNITGWIIYALIYFFVIQKKLPDSILSFYLRSITFIVGFGVTVLLRYVYRFLSKIYPSIFIIITLILIGSVLGTITWYIVDVSLSRPFMTQEQWLAYDGWLSFRHIVKRNFAFFFAMLSWSALYFGIKFFIDFQSEKKQKEEALILAQRAELEMLRYQLNPHFLFNALNSIRGLIDENKKNAKEMINELSEFLRYSLIHKDIAYVPLSNELEAIKHYLSIEKKRFEEKLIIQYQITNEAASQSILSLLLHPLVENAVKHGMKNSPLPLQILIEAKFENNILLIQICNTGKWVDKSEKSESTGTGLTNVERRLKNAYGNNFKFDIQQLEDKVCIRIEIDKNNHDTI